ncbi:MAG TPA: hypothetical protein VFC19_44465 [Candidatus Limnocylindrales bacterium]|nr:hypothetical protein [Candidatus Limnocylindrales bacterium]
MTQPKPSTDTRDAQEFVSAVADEIEASGYPTLANAMRSSMPDADPTNIGGGTFSAENVAGAIATSVIDYIRDEVSKSKK